MLQFYSNDLIDALEEAFIKTILPTNDAAGIAEVSCRRRELLEGESSCHGARDAAGVCIGRGRTWDLLLPRAQAGETACHVQLDTGLASFCQMRVTIKSVGAAGPSIEGRPTQAERGWIGAEEASEIQPLRRPAG